MTETGTYLMQAGHAIIINQPRVGPMGKQQSCNFRVPTVAGPVQGCGTPVGLGITLCSTFQQKLANSIVPIATSIVLQGAETEVRQQSPGG